MISKKFIYIFLTALSLLIITGCSTSKEEVKQVKALGEFDNAPAWVESPNVSGFISLVAKSEKNDETFRVQRDTAIAVSREQLSNVLTVKIKTVFNLLIDGIVNVDNELYKQRSDALTIHIVEAAMQNAKITNLWQNHSENIYVKISTPTNKIKKDIVSSIKSTFLDMTFVNSNYKLYEEQGKIDEELK